MARSDTPRTRRWRCFIAMPERRESTMGQMKFTGRWWHNEFSKLLRTKFKESSFDEGASLFVYFRADSWIVLVRCIKYYPRITRNHTKEAPRKISLGKPTSGVTAFILF